MDPIRNPFAPGAGTRPRELAGRETIISDAETALRRCLIGRPARSQILLGLRGTGKTVLLNEIRRIADEAGFQSSQIEAPEDRPLAELLYPIMHKTLRKLSTVEAARAHTVRALAGLRSFASAFKITLGDVEIGVDLEPGTADSGNLELDLPEMFLLIGEAAKAACRGWALLIDEVQYLREEELSALIVSVHRIAQSELPVIFYAAGLPQIAKLSGDAKSYAERLFAFEAVGALAPTDAREAVRKPLEEEGVSITDDALGLIVEMTSGYPFFIQEWGHHAWNLTDESPILTDIMAKAEALALARLDNGFFRVRMDRLTAAEIDYVNAMAALGHGPYRSTEVAAKLGKAPSSLGPRRASIIRKGMIYSPSYGDIDFTVPLFDEFLRRRGA